MSISADTLALLVASGLSGERLVEVVRSIEADHTKKQSSGAQRQARYRARKAGDATRDATGDASRPSPLDVPPFLPPAPPSIPPLNPPIPQKIGLAPDLSFDQVFWVRYPHKVGKPAAQRSYLKARQKHSVETIMAGLERYIRDRPPDRPWLNPATFLNQERFNDLPASLAVPAPSTELPKWQGPNAAPSAVPSQQQRPDVGVLPQGPRVHPEPQVERRGPVLRDQSGHRGMAQLGGVLPGLLRSIAPRDGDGRDDGRPGDVHRPGPMARVV